MTDNKELKELEQEMQPYECEIVEEPEKELPMKVEEEDVDREEHAKVEEPAESKCHCHEEHKDNNPVIRHRKRCSEILVNKTEGLLMFIMSILMVGICFMMMQNTIVDLNNNISEELADVSEQIYELQMDVTALKGQIADLESKIDMYNADETKQPINIIVNADGTSQEYTYDHGSDSFEQGTVTDPNANFDTSPFLGVGFTDEILNTHNPIGLQVTYVYPYSPAEFAGMKIGDIIMSINGSPINTFEDLDAVISQHAAEDFIEIQYATITDTGINVITTQAQLTYRGNFDLGE